MNELEPDILTHEQPWDIFTNDNPEKLKGVQSVLKDINNYAKSTNSNLCNKRKSDIDKR